MTATTPVPAATHPRRGGPGDLLLRPWVALSVLVLLLNDHVLKWIFGNTVTGKLSDVAGVFLLPLLMLTVAELAARVCGVRWIAGRRAVITTIAVVGVGFAAVKTLPPVGDAYEYMVGLLRAVATFSGGPVTPIIVYRDATDLLVLPVLIGTYLVVTRCRRVVPHDS